MDESNIPEVLHKTLLPLFLTYLPILVTVLLAWITINQLYFKEDKKTDQKENGSHSQKTNRKPTGISNNKQPKKKLHSEKWYKDSKQPFTHEWLVTSLKGHNGHVLDMDFSANGKYLATCADDRAVFIWNTKDWKKEKDHKFIRYNIDYDHASFIRWSPDSKAFVYLRSSDNYIEVCKLVKKPDGWISSISKATSFPKVHDQVTIGLGIAVNGKFIMTASSNTEMILWDLKGIEITKLDSYLMNNYTAKVSPCGTLVAASGFAADVKVWEVLFSKTGEFKQVNRAFELTGHNAGVFDFDFSADSSQVVTLSKDGNWRLFDIKIEYTKGEEPHLLKSGSYKCDPLIKACVALSPDGQVIAIGSGSCLIVINALNGLIDLSIPNLYASGTITKVLFDAAGEYILTSGEKHVRILHNVTGYKIRLQLAKSKLNQPGNSQATKERLQKTIEESEQFLANFSE